MYNKHEFMSTYLQEQIELNNEWYNLQKNLIYLENVSMLEGLPKALVSGIYTYIFGVEDYFKKMYEIIKKEWNYFYLYYKKSNKEIKEFINKNDKLLKQGFIDLSFYGFNFDFNKNITYRYIKLSPTDGITSLTPPVMKKLTKSSNKTMKTEQLTTERFNEIRGKILNKATINEEEFRREIDAYFRTNTVKSLININSLNDTDMKQTNTLSTLISVKKEIDLFYNNVLKFLNEYRSIEDKNLSAYTSNIGSSINMKVVNEYMLVKTIEFRNFAQIYNTLLLSLLTCVRDKVEQDKEIISLIQEV